MAWNGSELKTGPAGETKGCGDKRRLGWILLIVGLAVAAGVAGVLLPRGGATPSESSNKVAAPVRTPRKIVRPVGNRAKMLPEEAVRAAMPGNVPKRRGARRHGRVDGLPKMLAHLQGQDRKLAEAVQAALDVEDFEQMSIAAKASLKSKNPEVRENAIEALGVFGAEALPLLTSCLADRNDEVREAAENRWELALQEIEKPADQFAIAAAAFATLSGEDTLTSLGGILSGAATEMIDGEDDEERAAENRLAVLQSLVDIIEGGSAENATAAKEAYNDITGHEWANIDEAERYLADPDNYDPDEAASNHEAEDETVDAEAADGEDQTQAEGESAGDGEVPGESVDEPLPQEGESATQEGGA